MEQEEKNKEIEWLMGSIQRSYTHGKAEALFLSIFLILLAIVGILYYVFGYDKGAITSPDDYAATDVNVPIFGGIACVALILMLVIQMIFRKKMVKAETPQELLATHDRMWKISAAFGIIFAVCTFFLVQGSLISRICFVLAAVLLVITGWLAMNNKLSLPMGIVILLVESVLFYFSNFDLITGLLSLILVLSVIKGEKTLLAGGGDATEDEDTAQEIKQLRELLKK